MAKPQIGKMSRLNGYLKVLRQMPDDPSGWPMWQVQCTYQDCGHVYVTSETNVLRTYTCRLCAPLFARGWQPPTPEQPEIRIGTRSDPLTNGNHRLTPTIARRALDLVHGLPLGEKLATLQVNADQLLVIYAAAASV